MSQKLESPGAQTVDFDLLQAGALRVRVLDSTGRLLPNRHVQSHATGQRRSTSLSEIRKRSSGITNEQGVALLENVPPGQQEITAFEYSHWSEAKAVGIAVYGGQVSETTLITSEKDQSTYAGVLFLPQAIGDLEYSDSGIVKNYRLFYRIGKFIRNVQLFREWDHGVIAVVPSLPVDKVECFIAQCDDKAEIRNGARKSRAFDIFAGATISAIPVWEK